MTVGDLGIRVERVSPGVQRGDAEPALLDPAPPLLAGRRVAQEQAPIAMCRRRVAAASQLEVGDGGRRVREPAEHRLQRALGECLRDDPQPQPGLPASVSRCSAYS